jgi:type IV pilus assembly protein PilA
MKEALRKKTKGKKGFTLVELVIVIAVLAIIAAIAIPTVSNVINNANASADASNAQSIELAIKTAQSECAAYNTNHSTKVEAMGLADKSSQKLATAGTTVTLEKLLNTYGVDAAVITSPKVANDKFFYNSTTGKVIAATETSDKTSVTLDKDNTSFKLGADGSLEISAATPAK